SGGGDLLGYEFVPGIGGSSDVLDPSSSGAKYAILPAYQGAYAPYDPQIWATAGLQMGDSLYLAGGGGLPAGNYVLLPARYALLPGAFLITPRAGTSDIAPGEPLTRSDGAAIVAGQRTVAGTPVRDSRWSGFVVEPGSIARTRSEYRLNLAASLFAQQAAINGTAVPLLPNDAGQLMISSDGAIGLEGCLQGSPAAGGREAQVDIAANDLAVVNTIDPHSAGVQLRAADLNGLGASVLLGGTRKAEHDGTHLNVTAQQVRVQDGVTLTDPEVTLAATDAVDLGAGSKVAGTGSASGSDTALVIDGDGALLRVSAADQVDIKRTGTSGATGTLSVGAGAVVQADRSIVMDATAGTRSDGRIDIAGGGSFNLGAERISLGKAPTGTGGLVLAGTDLNALHLGQLVLTSRSTVNLYGAVGLNANELRIDAAGIGGYGAAGDRSILSAHTLQLDNTAGATLPSAAVPAGSGELTVDATDLNVGPGSVTVSGFGKVTLAASGQLSGQGVGSLDVNGDLTIKAGRVTAGSAADTTLDAGGHTVTIASASAPISSPTGSLGGHLSILGRSILQQGRIEVPAGTVTLHATGSDAGDDVTLAAGSVTDVAGPQVQLGDVSADAPGGRVILTADAGNVVAQAAAAGLAAARIDVSGSGDAGTLSANAPQGEVRLSAADLAGQGGSGHAQGSFRLDAATVDDLLGLNVRLDAAGFTAARRLRVRTGDVLLKSSVPGLIRAHRVWVTADGGSITVQGSAGKPVIDASGDTGGSVTLSARDDVILDSDALVDAHATAAGAKGGTVALRSGQGGVTLSAGSQVKVAGGSGGSGGSVAIRLARSVLDAGAGVTLDGTVSGAASATVEGYQAYQVSGDGTIPTTDMATYDGDANTFMSDAVTRGLYGDLKAKGFTLTPGVEVDGSGDLTLGADWDLHSWRFGPDSVPGVLTLRAAGNLTLPHSLSDGFDSSGLLAGASWSYRLVSGADTASADPLALLPAAELASGQGSLTLGTAASPQTIRTGTGSIDIATGGNLVLADSASTIYTAGVPTGSGTENSILVAYAIPGDYPAGGGDIDIRAQGDIKAQPVKQLITAWLGRLGEGDPSSSPGLPTTWNINFKNFQQGIGALGGGSVTVRADGNITNLSVSVPTTGKQVGEPLNPTDPSNFQVKQNQIDVQGGGNIRVTAGGDIGSGVFFEDGGTATLRADGSIEAAPGNAVRPILALGSGTFDLQAARDVALETVFNAPMVKQTPYANPMPPGTGSAFFTYGADSAVNITALGGDVRLYNDITHITDSSLFPSPGYTAYGTDQQLRDALTIYPGTLRVDALLGSIDLKNSLTLFPSANGHLELLAGNSISTLGNTQAKITQSDADPALQPSMLQPIAADSPGAYTNNPLFGGGVQALHATTPVHTGDPVPVRIVAAHGDIGGADTSQSITVSLAEQARIQAGRDILNLILYGQNLAPTDVTSVRAGRDIRSVNTRDPNTGLFTVNGLPLAQLGGAGQLEVLAGRNLDLGVGDGIITTGARFNPSLSPTGASVTVMAGLSRAPDYGAFIGRYLGAGRGYSDRVTGYMRALTGHAGLDAATALAQFKALPVVEQRAVVLQAFFNELKQSGIHATSGSKDYSRGFAAIATLFPGGPATYQGDISLPFSRVQTLAGGDINMLAPGGQVDGGVASTSVFVKPASQLGVVAVSTGDINGFVDGDFLVNQSRVFALDGGTILLWSSRGNIDAGRGAKTALAASPPVVTTNSNGEVVVTYPPTVSGSGIRNGVATPGRSAGNIYLFAPGGVVNAGDAGIATAGNLTIGATQVIGSDNINVGGVSVGVPVADTGSLAAGLTGVSNLSSTVSKSAEQATQSVTDRNNAGPGLGADTLTMIDVQVLGYGE
ncbi:MAG TPA: filamentous hemagglutinin family protein, partial [Gammaproteobacteria bacterium]|nr:filamentous hemagglutinin family protein [Gammaproteobacteria bacterium]